MAEKTAVFSLKVNTGNSVQDIQNMDSAIENLNQDIKATQKTAADNSGIDKFTSKLDELDKKLASGTLTTREMTKLMKEYQTVATQAGTQTPIGDRAIRSAASLKDTLADLSARTKLLSSDYIKLDTSLKGVETGAAAFQGIQSAAALAGVENEKLAETMVKLQAVQGLVNSVSIITNNLNKDAILGIQVRIALEKAKNFILTGSIAPALANVAATQAQSGANVALATSTTGATTAMKLFRLALIATGIGALVVGLGLLIANWDKVTEAVRGAIKWFDKLGPVAKTVVSLLFPIIAVVKGIVSALEYFGVVDDEMTAKMKKNARERTEATEKELNKKISAEKRKAQAVDDNYSFEIRKSQAAGKTTEEMEEKKLQAALKSGRAILEMQKQKIAAYEDEIKLQKSLKNVDEERVKSLEKTLKDVKKNKNEQYKENVKLKQDLEVLRIEQDKAEDDAAKAAADKAKARADKRREDAKKEAERLAELARKANEERIKAEDEQFQLSLDLMAENQEKELLMSTIKYDKMRDQAHGNANLLHQIAVQEGAERIAIVNKYNQMELDKIAEAEAKKRAIRKQFESFLNTDQENELQDLEDWYKQQDAINTQGALDEEEQFEALLKLNKQYQEKKAEIDKKYADQTKANEVKAREEQLKGVTAAIEGAQKGLDELKKINALVNEIDQARLNSIAKNRDEDLSNLDKNLQAQLSQEGLTAEQRTKIEESFAQQKYQVQLKAYNEEEKIKKAQFAREKALRLAQIGIDTASAIVKGIAQFGPPPSPAGIAAIASASLIGITQALAVMNQQYQSGSAPTPPQLSAGGGATAGAGSSEFTANTQAQTTDLNQLDQGQQQGQTSTQVFVLESDITNTQNKVELQEAKSTF